MKEKQKAVEEFITRVSKVFGEGSVIKGDAPALKIERVSSGSVKLDEILGGGYPVGKVVEIFGPESSGKTTLALHVMAEVQKKGGNCLFIDAEYALSSEYAKGLGVNLNSLCISQPNHGQQVFDVIYEAIRSNAFDLIVVDSVPAIVPQEEISGNFTDTNSPLALRARLLSKGLAGMVSIASQSKTIVLFINQLRDKVGGFGYGPTSVTTGGKSLPYYSSIRIEIKKIKTLKDGDNIYG